MKLIDLAKKTIELIKTAGDEGVINLELAKMLEMPRRRIYDIIAILKAAKLVTTSREKSGTKVTWIDLSSNMPEIDSLTKKSYGSNEPNELPPTRRSFTQVSPFQTTNISHSKSFSDPFERILVDSPCLKIRTTSKITRIKPIGIMELLVECDSPGFIIEARHEDKRKIKEVENAIIDTKY